MKKKPSQSAFFNPRVILAFAVCLIAALLALIGFGVFTGSSAQAQGDDPAAKAAKEALAKQERAVAPKPTGVISITSERNDVSPPLRNQPPWPVTAKRPEREANANPKIPHQHVDGKDPVVQNSHPSMLGKLAPSIPLPNRSFDGIPFPGVGCNCAPPDTNGEVGSTQFVQMVNEGLQVWDKATPTPNSLLGPVGIQSIWAGFGGVCETGGSGDPVVLYDQLADRWVISQFAGSPPNHECIAVSKTNDATGMWHRYDFNLVPFGNNFYDYPHLGVWPDGYYMAMNIFNAGGTAYLGGQAFAFDRAKMLVGLPATAVSPGILPGGASDETFLPADLDGLILPPAGAPATFVYWPGGELTNPFLNMYRVMHFHADFVTPALTTFTLFAAVPSGPFTALCPTTRACVPELGVPAGLDAIADRLMFRLAYRKFADGHEAVVGNFTVSSNAVGGVRWFELRNVTAGPVTAFQDSTYQPDTTWRWMGSTAMDNQGNLALGFSASDALINPQIRYAGRLAGDPINVLSQGEATLFAGTGSQSGTGNRWGDYSDLTIDPVDDCTFWYTQEYYAANGSFLWRTRAGSFAFTQCTPPPKGTAHFIVTICSSGAALADAVVTIDGNVYGSSLPTTGFYDAMLTPGPHTYSVSKPTFGTVTGSFSIANGGTTNVPVCLAGAPLLTAGTATLVSESCAPPNGVIDPGETVTVAFPVQNIGGADTVNDVGTLQASGGVTGPSGPQNYGALVAGGAAVSRNFTFTADPMLACGSNITATVAHVDGVSNLGNLTYTLPTGVAGMTPTTTSYTGPPVFVPDNVPAGSNIILPVSGFTGGISDLNFRLDSLAGCSNAIGDTNASMDHTFNADLTFKLTSPQGTTVTLIALRGGAGNNFCTVVLDDAAVAATSTMSTAGAIAGTFRPESPLSAFNGQNPNGNWTLNVADTAGIDTGFLRRYSLIITPKICCVGGPPVPQSAVSRKTHNTSPLPMDFDVVLPLVPVSGAVGIEPRMGPAHTMVVSFASAVTTTGAIVTTGTGTVGSVTGSGTGTIVINLTGVSDVQRLGVTLQNVNDGMGHVGDVLIPMGVLLGDTNGSGAPIGVSSSDVVQTKAAASSGVVNGGTFRTDMNASGAVNSSDVSLVKSRSGAVLPP